MALFQGINIYKSVLWHSFVALLGLESRTSYATGRTVCENWPTLLSLRLNWKSGESTRSATRRGRLRLRRPPRPPCFRVPVRTPHPWPPPHLPHRRCLSNHSSWTQAVSSHQGPTTLRSPSLHLGKIAIFIFNFCFDQRGAITRTALSPKNEEMWR